MDKEITHSLAVVITSQVARLHYQITIKNMFLAILRPLLPRVMLLEAIQTVLLIIQASLLT